MLRHLYVKISFWIFDENQKFQNFLKVFQIYFLESLETLLRGSCADMFPLNEVSSKGVHSYSKDLSTKLKNLSFKECKGKSDFFVNLSFQKVDVTI